MPKKVDELAHQRITDHEKLCRIMQKQTQNQIIKLQKQIDRLEKVIISAAGVIIIGLFAVVFALLKLHVW